MFCPLKYKTIVTNQKLKIVCVAQFILAVILTLIQFNIPVPPTGFYCGNVRRISITGRLISWLLLLFNVIPYLFMLWYLKKQRQSVARVGEESNDKMMGKITLISSFLVVCYAPVIIMTDIQAIFPSSGGLRIVLFICEFLALINSVMNPVLYAWRFYEVRFQFLRLICGWNSSRMDVLRQRRQQHFATFEINTRQVVVQSGNERTPSHVSL